MIVRMGYSAIETRMLLSVGHLIRRHFGPKDTFLPKESG